MSITIDNVLDVGDDVLQVLAHDTDSNELTATGWVSATTNHYDPASYDAAGNLLAGATPRAMTPAEVGEYALQLVREQHPELFPAAPAPAPTAVPFTPPA